MAYGMAILFIECIYEKKYGNIFRAIPFKNGEGMNAIFGTGGLENALFCIGGSRNSIFCIGRS